MVEDRKEKRGNKGKQRMEGRAEEDKEEQRMRGENRKGEGHKKQRREWRTEEERKNREGRRGKQEQGKVGQEENKIHMKRNACAAVHERVLTYLPRHSAFEGVTPLRKSRGSR